MTVESSQKNVIASEAKLSAREAPSEYLNEDRRQLIKFFEMVVETSDTK